MDTQEQTFEALENIHPKYEGDGASRQDVVTPKSISDRYVFIEEIGHGAQGRIYKSVRLSDNQIVVIKQLNVSSVKTWKEYELFKREGKVLKSLDIPGVAHFYDAIECLDEDPAYSYIVQEFIPGASLKTMIDAGHRFKMDDVYDILIQALRILDKLHHHDPVVIHRDIKPSNIMITPEDDGHLRVTIIDFGAVANPQIQGGGSTVAGTYGYMPPEQLTGKPCPASDVYALAAVGVQLFSAKSPTDMPVKDFRLIFEPDMQDKPHELVSLLRKMLEPKVENRLGDIDAIIEQLNAFKSKQFDMKQVRASDSDYDKDYVDALAAVQSVGENGNLDLWQLLPDKTPRNVPEPFYSRIYSMPETLEYPLANFNVHPKGMKLFCVGCAVLYVGVILGCLIFGESRDIMMIVAFLLFWTFMIGPILFVILKVTYSESGLRRLKPGAGGTHGSEGDDGTHVDDESKRKSSTVGKPGNFLKDLMTDGRKGIATITSIRYLPMSEEQIASMDLVGDQVNAYKKMLYFKGLPQFEIQYKFNPPDDRREEDIIHHFMTHVNPQEYCKVGDPLPILYLIEDCYFYDIVKSMPFPYPVSDIYDCSQISVESTSKDNRLIPNKAVSDGVRQAILNRQEYIQNELPQRNVEAFSMSLSDHLKYDNHEDLKKYIEKIYLHELGRMNELNMMHLCTWIEKIMNTAERIAVHPACMELLWKLAFDINGRVIYTVQTRATEIILKYLEFRKANSPIPAHEAIERMFEMIARYKKDIAGAFRLSIWSAIIDLWISNKDLMMNKVILDNFYRVAPKEWVKTMYGILRDSQSRLSYGFGKEQSDDVHHWLEIYEKAIEN